MKRFLLSLVLVAMGVMTSFGRGFFTFSDAQQQAYFLTDKMAYELDLTPAQYDQVYQVNLEYFINVDRAGLYGPLWDFRNVDLSYILFDWQYAAYRRTAYFYRPIEWRHSSWYLPLWDRYHRTYFFFGRPTIWDSWRGGLWINRHDHNHSPFIGHRPPQHNGGMRHDRQPGGHIGGQPGGKPHNNNHGGSYYNPNPGHNNNNHGGNIGGNNRPNNNNGYNGGNHNNGGNIGGNSARPNNGGNMGGSRGGSSVGGSRGGASMGNGNRGGAGAPSRSGGNAGGGSRGTRSFGH